MNRGAFTSLSFAGLLVVVMLSGCGSDTPAAPALAPFQPEIVNDPDNFSFQATAIQNVTTTVSYVWQNSGPRATIDHSSAVTEGVTAVAIYDSVDSLVYSGGLPASANESSNVGVEGN